MPDNPITDGYETIVRSEIIEDAANAAAEAAEAVEMALKTFNDIQPDSSIIADTAARVAGAVVCKHHGCDSRVMTG